MNEQDLKSIIEATALHHERLNPTLFYADGIDDVAMSLWKQYASGEMGREYLEKALTIRGLTKSNLETEMCHVKLVGDAKSYLNDPSAQWLCSLSNIVDSYNKGYLFYLDLFKDQHFPKGNITLCRALLPFLSAISNNLVQMTGLEKKIALNIGFSCFEILEPICCDVFMVAAKSHFETEDVSSLYYTGGDGDDRKYLEWVFNGGIIDIVKYYPMCFRLLMQSILNLENNIIALFRRLTLNLDAIEEELFDGVQLGKIIDVKVGLSDLHNSGQSVCILKFSNNVKLVYKPRSMAIDAAWNNLLKDLCNDSDVFKLSTLRVLDRGDYGFVTFANWVPAVSIEKYYYNAGVIMCLAALFGATDLHYENIIASGDSPIIVDLETLISPRPKKKFAMIEAGNREIKAVDVGRTMLLPRWVGTSIRAAREIGGFTSISDLGKNYHLVDGKKTSADQYSKEVLHGFSCAYNYIITHKQQISYYLQKYNFDKGKYRYVFRRTALYYDLYKHFLHATFLRRASLFEAVTTRLGAGILLSFDSEKAHILWPMEQSEEAAILQGDIPYFYCLGDKKGIADISGTLIHDFFETTPMEIVRNNLAQMTSARLEYESNYIKNALILSKCQSQQTLSTELLSYQHINRSRVMPDNEAICREIKRIYAMLDKYSIDGLYFSYYAPVRDDKTTRYNLNLLDNSYYSGIWGVLMFHAAYATWNNNSVLRDTILKEIKELLRPYFDGSDESVYLRLGLAEGVSGVLKSMICIAKILDEPNLVDSAVKIANRVGENYLRRSWGSDLFGGIAGYLFVVCQLYLLTRDEMLYGQIRAACEELKSRNTVESTNQLHVWKSEMEYAPLTGLAHGQAGFAMALSAAYAVTSDDTLLTLINQCMCYEELNYDRENNNWYDFRKFMVARRDQDLTEKYHKRFMFGCCSGTPGIGISRITTIQLLNDISENQVVNRAINFCCNEPLIGNDSYCCGTMGWIDFLIEASMLHHDSSLLSNAKSIASSVIPSISGKEYILSNLKGIYDISLFKGISGIGYELIRTQMPNKIPSPLSL